MTDVKLTSLDDTFFSRLADTISGKGTDVAKGVLLQEAQKMQRSIQGRIMANPAYLKKEDPNFDERKAVSELVSSIEVRDVSDKTQTLISVGVKDGIHETLGITFRQALAKREFGSSDSDPAPAVRPAQQEFLARRNRVAQDIMKKELELIKKAKT